MRRYHNSYRVVHYNEFGVADAVGTIDASIYEDFKASYSNNINFHGNGYVKTINIHNNYDLYKTVRDIYRKRILQGGIR